MNREKSRSELSCFKRRRKCDKKPMKKDRIRDSRRVGNFILSEKRKTFQLLNQTFIQADAIRILISFRSGFVSSFLQDNFLPIYLKRDRYQNNMTRASLKFILIENITKFTTTLTQASSVAH